MPIHRACSNMSYHLMAESSYDTAPAYAHAVRLFLAVAIYEGTSEPKAYQNTCTSSSLPFLRQIETCSPLHRTRDRADSRILIFLLKQWKLQKCCFLTTDPDTEPIQDKHCKHHIARLKPIIHITYPTRWSSYRLVQDACLHISRQSPACHHTKIRKKKSQLEVQETQAVRVPLQMQSELGEL